MKKIYTLLFVTTTFFSLFISCENAVQNKASDNYNKVFHVVDSIRIALQDTLHKPVSSLNILITTPTEEIFASSSVNTPSPITKDTYFRFASNTKNFTSASVLNMQEDGWLNIESKIIDIIPGSNLTYTPTTSEWDIPNKNQITIKQLLQHSAGVYDISNDTVPGYPNGYLNEILALDPNHQFTPSELVGVVTTNNLSYFLPGTNYHYSNTGYTILSEIIARVYTSRAGTPKKYSDYLYDYVVGGYSPIQLGIKFPYLATDNQMPTPNVPGIIYNPDGSITNTAIHNMSAHIAEGNGYSTMSMLRTYIRTMLSGTNVLTPATVNLMKTEISPGSQNYALGCSFLPNLGFGHTGATHGYFSIMIYDPLTDVSVIGMIPFWDLTSGGINLFKPYYALIDACYAARSALGFPGKP